MYTALVFINTLTSNIHIFHFRFFLLQCFCFEEQRLNPHEKVDMPVFFYLDPEFAEDPKLFRANHIILHYTFFQARREKLSIPGISSTNVQPVTS
ncbi:hypothetical protein EG68_12303 [Paragonimus skrjabini miyazakii]|uniref:Uncharacterized protein n=1 Tax=Paragonimus skrjabini miyazakii TaxID=59628 RepID=A0A8S9YAP9_9TREM|nr:hypothetical protein EG68_12303 [Paragonimus skrjabini miyazakii]